MAQEIKTLTPKNVRLESSLKYFGLEKGSSEGTTISIEYGVPEGITRKDLTILMLAENERLDLFCLLTERLRGALTDADYTTRRDALKAKYKTLLKPVEDASHVG